MPAPPARTEISDTYPNPSNSVARGGFGKLWDYAVGLLGSTGNPEEARVALGLGLGSIGSRNIVINGSFGINQRAVSGTVTLAAGAYGLDRWKAGASGCTFTMTASGLDTIINITSGSLVQVIEGANVVGGSYVMTWEGTGLAKIAGGAFSPIGVTVVGVSANTNLTIELSTGTFTRVQVESGPSASVYDRRLMAQELALCQRYYQVVTGSWRGALPYAGGIVNQGITWPTMRAAPTVGIASGPGFTTTNVSLDSLIVNQPQGGRWELTLATQNTDSYVLNRLFRLSAEL